MAYRSTRLLPVNKFIRAGQQVVAIKNYVDELSLRFSNGADSGELLSLIQFMREASFPIRQMRKQIGIKTIAQVEHGDASYDIMLESLTLLSAMGAVMFTVRQFLPKSTSGDLAVQSLDTTDRLINKQFTALEIVDIRQALGVVSQEIQ